MGYESPSPGGAYCRYQLLSEIARDSYRAVYRSRDLDLGRELCVKVLLEVHRDKPELVRRFVEEAQISGQLMHPGIPPVYELGTFADRRPYFAMKLVRGRTLAELLGDRKTPKDDLPKFIAIFEQVCQTVAYAHARRVMHRALMPSHIMVGAFGEVQVMDWGLAKVLPPGGAGDAEPDGRDGSVATARNGADVKPSHAELVGGTAAYLAPEQVRDEGGLVDKRADVFALGSILCELLTGQPAFAGRTPAEIQRKATRGDLSESSALLKACGADPKLIALARICLAAEPHDRPPDAGAVASAVTSYEEGVQARLHEAALAWAAYQGGRAD
jgi:serine/threonine protein kinase